MVWWNLYTFNNKKCRPKKTFLHKESHSIALIGVLISSKQHKELGPACQSCVLEFSYSPTGKITIQIQPDFAENHGKQTQKGFLLSNEKMSCRHTKSPFYTLRYPGPRGFSWFFFAKEIKSKPRSGDNESRKRQGERENPQQFLWLCEQKPYPVWYSWQHKGSQYTVNVSYV